MKDINSWMRFFTKHEIIGIAIFVVVLFASVVLQGNYVNVSPEVQFADMSKSNLSIVPASCPSDPHFAGECSGEIPPGGDCSLNASSYSISPGQPVTLSWAISSKISESDGGGCFFRNCNIAPVSATIIPRIGSVPVPNGSTTDYPPSTTNYIMTATYQDGDRARCSAIVTVQEASLCVPVYTCSGNGVLNSCTGVVTPCPPGNPCASGQCQSRSCTAGYFCSGNDLYFRSAQCVNSFIQACAWGCAGSACLPPPSPTGTIKVNPSLISSGRTTQVTWSSTNTTACTVTENNPDINDSWTGVSGSQQSSEIRRRTTYKLTCTGVDGSEIAATATVYMRPIENEK